MEWEEGADGFGEEGGGEEEEEMEVEVDMMAATGVRAARSRGGGRRREGQRRHALVMGLAGGGLDAELHRLLPMLRRCLQGFVSG